MSPSSSVLVSSSFPVPHPLEGPIELECLACPYCSDTCDVESCVYCKKKRNALHLDYSDPGRGWLADALSILSNSYSSQDHVRTYTMCQLRRHNKPTSAWILVGNTIYDATPYIQSHPGGTETILRKAGGAADCTDDLRFHSKRAQKEWRKFKVGMLVQCQCYDCR
jgi:hypothetical protein